jgi:hypothetical protein
MDDIKLKVEKILKLLDDSEKYKGESKGCRAAELLHYNLLEHGGLIIKELTKREEKLREALENIANIDVKDLKAGGECPYQHTKNIIENAKYALQTEEKADA